MCTWQHGKTKLKVKHSATNKKSSPYLCKQQQNKHYSLSLLTSSKGQKVFDSQRLGLEKMASDFVLGAVGTRDVEHRLKTAVVEGCTGYCHGTGLLVSCGWVGGREGEG